MLAWILPGVGHLQNIHPLVVHYPVALLTGAVGLYWIAWVTRRDSVAWVALWMLVLGTASAAVAIGTGLYAAPGVMLALSVKHRLLVYHKWLMLGVGGLSAVLTLWALAARPMPMRLRVLFLSLTLVLAGLVARGADYGGRMVYDYNAGGNACGQPIEFNQ